MRLILSSLLLAVVGLTAVAARAPAGAAETPMAVMLNNHVVVEDRLVRLGDLFTGLDAAGATPIARAPEPGNRAEVDARWLAAVAKAYGLPWRPSSPFDRAIIERASQVIDGARIEQSVRDALRDQGLGEKMSLVLDNPAQRLHLSTDVTPSLTVAGLSFDRVSGRFSAQILAPAEGTPQARAIVTGRVVEMAEVPVLRRRVSPGEVIRDADIEWISLRSDRLGRDAVIDPVNLVGKSPRRPIRAGEPLRSGDLRDPILVPKNSLVTIRLETPRMVLTAQGRSLEAGAKGDAIRVMNTKSSKVINAVVSEPGIVVVLTEVAAASAVE